MSPSISDLAKARIIVIGDMMVDRYIHGHWSKISGEGVPVFLETHREDRPGGAANVGAQLAALGCRCTGFGKLPPERPRKVRYYDRQTVFRADLEDCSPIDEASQRAVMAFLEASSGYHALVISDYAKGVCTPELCRGAIDWAKRTGLKVVVDPKGLDWRKYGGADLITPNQTEIEAVNLHNQPHNSGKSLLDVYGIGACLVTKGARGMVLENPHPIHIPATNPSPVDVTGCGDTVTAVMAAALAVGFDLPQAARLANAAAGVTVGKPGTASCSLAELEAACRT